MRNIKEMRELLINFEEQKTSDTPQALINIIDKIQTAYEKYNTATTDVKKEQYFEEMNIYGNQFDSMYYILENLKINASKKHPDYTVNHYRSEDDTEIKGISGALIVDDMLEKVHMKSGLRNPTNIMHQIIKNTVGWWYDNNDTVYNLRKFMLKYATGNFLDLLAEQYGFTRKEGEDDESLRARLLAHFTELFRKDYVMGNGDLKIFTKNNTGNPQEYMTSTNLYLTNDYYIYAPDSIRDYWSDKYITWRDIIWL